MNAPIQYIFFVNLGLFAVFKSGQFEPFGSYTHTELMQVPEAFAEQLLDPCNEWKIRSFPPDFLWSEEVVTAINAEGASSDEILAAVEGQARTGEGSDQELLVRRGMTM